MGETTFAQSYLSKKSLITITFDDLEVLARVLGYSMKDLNFILDYAEAAALARRMGCKTMGEYQHRWDPKIHLPFFPDIFYAGRGWPTGVTEGEAWKDFIYSTQAYYPKVHSQETTNENPVTSQGVPERNLPLGRVMKFQKPKRQANDFYEYAMAKQVTIKLAFRSRVQYFSGRKLDPRLPSNPPRNYPAEFEGWPIFLGVCSVEEAWEIIRQENCRFFKQYFELTKRFPSLPLHPAIYGLKWQNIAKFIMAAYAQK